MRGVAFCLFYYVILLALKETSATGLVLQNQAQLNCHAQSSQTKTVSIHGALFLNTENCCGTDRFVLGMGAGHLKYLKDCDVEPKNKTMSKGDCYWTVFDCVVKKSMGSTELTQTSFVELMAQNLPYEKRSEIVSLVGSRNNSANIVSHGNNELDSIKTYWANYFDAEYQVCFKTSLLTEEAKDHVKKKWAPAVSCANERHPNIAIMYMINGVYLNCTHSTTMSDIKPANFSYSRSFDSIKNLICMDIASGLLTQQDLTSAHYNYSAFLTRIVPNFFSKSLKEQFITMILNYYRAKYEGKLKAGPGESSMVEMQEIALEIMQDKESVVGTEINGDRKKILLRMLTIDDIHWQYINTTLQHCDGSNLFEDPAQKTQQGGNSMK